MTGVVEMWQPSRRFAFVRCEDGRQVFAQEPGIALRRNDRVAFELVWTRRGWRAVDVVPLEPKPAG